jgi:hypothetical protein
MSCLVYGAVAVIALYLTIGAVFLLAVSLSYGAISFKNALIFLLTWPRAFFL